MSYLASLNPLNLLGAMPGNVAQGLIWGLMALGVYITFRLLDFADLTVDGSFATGGAVTVVLILHGWSVPAALLIAILAGLAAGLITGLLHTLLGIPPILAGILTQIALYSINLNIMGMANLAVSVDQYPLLLSSRKITASILIALVLIAIVIMALYWYFGTEQGSAIRATGCNPAMSKRTGHQHQRHQGASALSAVQRLWSRCPAVSWRSIRGLPTSTWAAAPSSSAWPQSSSARSSERRCWASTCNFFGKLSFVVIGGIIYYIVVGIVLWLKLPSNDLKLFTAVIVAIFLAVPYLKGQSKSSFKKAAKKGAQNNA